ncbi:hypothetical protein LUZ60_016126 [Juncus effusus]|nr:hypothetical protein LUZ60_016126 [Juncus effusus]
MEIANLPISPSTRAKLVSKGYSNLSSFSSFHPSFLAQELNVSVEEATEILKAVQKANTPNSSSNQNGIFKGAQTAWDILSEEQMERQISTGCEEFDLILGGGIHCKEVTEIGGVPGIGKTQLGIQLAVNVQIPIEYGGLGGKAVYIDTEGSFLAERAYTEQIALINYLEKFLSEHRDVKVVIIDSITFHFRQDFDDLAQRTRVLGGLSLKLMKLSKTFNLAVVLLNQVTTKFTDGSYQLALALGDSWSHSCTNRIILHWNGNERNAYIEKSPSLPSASAPYLVTQKGISSLNSNIKRPRIV